jgi:hypothetical protein
MKTQEEINKEILAGPTVDSAYVQPTEGQFLGRLNRLLRLGGPPRVLAGPTEGSRFPQEKAEEDAEIVHRVRHVLRTVEEGPEQGIWNMGVFKRFRKRRQETLLEFWARGGPSRAQILTMSKEEITRHMEIVERNAADLVAPPSSFAMLNGFAQAGVLRLEPAQPAPRVATVDTGNDEPNVTYRQADPANA